ncbi:MAG: hypothetical protein M3Q39_01620 [Actinomycetota bacterium]|nr:hypothetical protein [Actinomycetota bacterium]
MATDEQRVQAIGDALINGVASPQLLNRMGQGLARIPSVPGVDYDALTPAQKRKFILKQLHQIITSHVKQHDAMVVARAAPVADPSVVDSEFAEAP